MSLRTLVAAFVLISTFAATTGFSISQKTTSLEFNDHCPLASRLDTMDSRLEALEMLMQQVKQQKVDRTTDQSVWQQLGQLAAQLNNVTGLLEQRLQSLLQPKETPDDDPNNVTLPDGSYPRASRLDTMDSRLGELETLLQQMRPRKDNGSYTATDQSVTQQLKQLAAQLNNVTGLLEQRLLQPKETPDDGPVNVTLPDGSYPRDCPLGFSNRLQEGRPVEEGHVPSCYKFSTDQKSWMAAKQHCVRLGADLISLETHAEHAHVVGVIQNNTMLQIPRYHQPPFWGYWTSGIEVTDEQWKWATGGDIDWGDGRWKGATSGNEDCLVMRMMEWHDVLCGDEFMSFICEIDAKR